MSLEWGHATRAAAKKLAAAISEVAIDRRHHKLAERALNGEFTDYSDAHECPITELYRLCRQFGLHGIADRVANGEFDATHEEADEWANSESGQEIARQLTPEMREIFGLKINS